jgi:hypothetical protein
MKKMQIVKMGKKGIMIALVIAVSIFATATVRAGLVFTLKTDADWLVKYYGTYETVYYGAINNETAIDLINASNAAGEFQTGPTRVYDTEWDRINLGAQGLGAEWGWAMSEDGAPWIGIRNGESANDVLIDPSTWYSDTFNSWNLSGYYTFETTFTLTGNLESIYFDVWNDNDLMAIYLTNSSGDKWEFNIFNPTAEDDYLNSAFAQSVNDANFAAGEYTLTFYLANGFHPDTYLYAPGTASSDGGGWNLPHGPVGLRVDGSMEYAIPEPATMFIVGLGVVGAGVASRRKMKK